MIQVSNDVRSKINTGTAKTHAKIVVDDRVFGYDNKNETAIPKDDGSIHKLNLQYDINKNEFAVGTSCIQMCEVMLYGASDCEFEKKYLKIYIGYERDEKFTVDGMRFPKIEWLPMGTFFTTEVTKKGKWVSFVGYDRTYKYTDMIYVPSKSLGNNPTVYDVFMDIFKFTGAPYDAESFENMMHARVDMKLLYGTDEDGNTTGYSVRNAMVFLSGKVGCNIIVNRYDKFQLLDYSFAVLKQDIGDGEYIEEGEYKITDSIISNAEIAGDGIHGMRYIDAMNSHAAVRYDNGNTDYKNGIVLDSPIIATENEAKAVLNHINNIYLWKGGTFYMTPCSFKLLNGDATLELGDIISYVPTKTNALGEQTYIPIMHMGINYTGKPEIDIAAYSQTETQQANRTGPIGRQFSAFKRAADNKYKFLDEAIEIVSNQITGADGGYIVVDKNEDGSWRQMRVLDDIENPNSMIVLNKNGIGFSNDGSGDITSAAITIDGKIVANSMTGGVLQAAQGYIGGWTINDTSMYSDYTDSNGNTYRAYIQNASAAGAGSWVFSTQQKSGDSFVGNFIVKVNGDTYVPRLYDDKSRTLIAYNDDSRYFVFGLGAYQKNYDAYYEGDTVYLRYKSDLQIQEGGTTQFTFKTSLWNFNNVDSNGKLIERDTIESAKDLVLSANGVSNDMFLYAKSIRFTSDTYLNETWSGAVPVYVSKTGKLYGSSSSMRYKENITDVLEDNLNPELLYNIPIKQYNYKKEYDEKALVSGTQIGIIAEDIEKFYPNALIRNADGQAESWQERILIPAMLKLIQEQKKEIDKLKEEQIKQSERLSEIERLIKNRAEN